MICWVICTDGLTIVYIYFFLLAMKATEIQEKSQDLSLRFYTQYCGNCHSSLNLNPRQQPVDHPITDQELRSDCPSQSHLKLYFT